MQMSMTNGVMHDEVTVKSHKHPEELQECGAVLCRTLPF